MLFEGVPALIWIKDHEKDVQLEFFRSNKKKLDARGLSCRNEDIIEKTYLSFKENISTINKIRKQTAIFPVKKHLTEIVLQHSHNNKICFSNKKILNIHLLQ
jgi:hypothetical protein